ncbi:hypothetical protein CROQUDRAFT_61079 [Cronartium quercuum f. sp. fusiforme G11]|uniref:G domain-containing protein n=1 Tax=Cronartium quercuum f. sp. fusiforme G11 TaxID=708437 RepID=A0A9P6NPX6_9BASI|nr:hypothetical protein CROQUDRAFT_61079 [Cronartium quercuum f. sp. fusiforme G11]
MPVHKKQVHNHGLGKAIMNHRAKTKVTDRERLLHTTEIYDNKPISVTQETDLENFLNTATLAGTEFTAERQNVTILPAIGANSNNNSLPNPYLLTPDQQVKIELKHKEYQNLLQVPRRPNWTNQTTPTELERLERDSFLNWRKNLAELVETNQSLILTPFERNLEVWRQLWRVIERSELIIQIVDSRNPLKFRCQDLEKYVNELNMIENQSKKRKNLLLINKADLLSEIQREIWAEYLIGQGIEFAFFSAIDAVTLQEQEIDEEVRSKEKSAHQSHSFDDADDDDREEEEEDDEEEEEDEVKTSLAKGSDSNDAIQSEEPTKSSSQEQHHSKVLTQDTLSSTTPNMIQESHKNVNITANRTTIDPKLTKVLTVNELESFFLFHAKQNRPELSLNPDLQVDENQPQIKTVIGLVGYPNVGKSSTINALIGSKKVSVSSTPGKTKHFQTIHLSNEIILCDCPGLVFPQFATTKAELVCDGVLPIDQMRDHTGPIGLLLRRIPKSVLESTYGLDLGPEDDNEEPNVSTLLSAYAIARGYSTGGGGQGRPDEARAARPILKDYMKAKLLYCQPPPLPNLTPQDFNKLGNQKIQFNQESRKKAPINRVPINADTYIRPTNSRKSDALDQTFFKSINLNGVAPIPELKFNVKGRTAQLDSPNRLRLVPNNQFQIEKSKKHFKGKRSGRMKMRSGKGYDEF